MRFGLCCLFKEEAISFRATTARALAGIDRGKQLVKLSTLCLDNASSLYQAVMAVRRIGIGAFRVMSPLFPRATHPEVGYTLEDLPDREAIACLLDETRVFCRLHQIRLSFHPDQFIVLSSPRPEVVAAARCELEHQAWLAEALGADVINVHAGGVYGDKPRTLERLRRVIEDLPVAIKSRLTLENDDISYTVRELLPVCEATDVPLVYDVHHHRCNPDGLSVQEATRLACETWLDRGGEQYCHLSSPKFGWQSGNPKPHADYIDPADFPSCWLGQPMTIDIEAKAKELAICRLLADLGVSSATKGESC